MTWREKLIARILLLVAQMVCDDPKLRQDIEQLSTHISVNAPAPDDELLKVV